MKKRILLILMLLITLTTGCESRDALKDTKILTTIYPIEFIVSRLYTEGEISSIYPNGADIEANELTDKQIKNYAKTTKLFVYNGLSNEKNIANELYERNKDMQMIEPAYGIKIKYGIEELWLNPNNLIWLASNIKTDLQTISNNKYANETIENNFLVLEEELATLDANLRNIGKIASESGNNTLVVSYDTFAYLEEYGFNIINISNENNVTQALKNNFKNKTYNYILIPDKNNVPNYIQDLCDNYGTTLIEVPNIATLTDTQRANKENYISIMQNYINTLSDITINE